MSTVHEYGTWLRGYAWDMWCTVSPKYYGMAESGLFRLFARFFTEKCAKKGYAFCSVEKENRYHLHALLGNTGLTSIEAEEYLCRHGRVTVTPYDPDGGAAFYVVKHLGKDKCVHEVFGEWPEYIDRENSGR